MSELNVRCLEDQGVRFEDQGVRLLMFNILGKDVRTEFQERVCAAHAVNDLKLLSNTDGTCKCSRKKA